MVHLLVQGSQMSASLPKQPHVVRRWLDGEGAAAPGKTALLAPGGGTTGQAFNRATGASLRGLQGLDFLSLPHGQSTSVKLSSDAERLLFVTGGSGSVLVDGGQKLPVRDGDLLLVPPGVPAEVVGSAEHTLGCIAMTALPP